MLRRYLRVESDERPRATAYPTSGYCSRHGVTSQQTLRLVPKKTLTPNHWKLQTRQNGTACRLRESSQNHHPMMSE